MIILYKCNLYIVQSNFVCALKCTPCACSSGSNQQQLPDSETMPVTAQHRFGKVSGTGDARSGGKSYRTICLPHIARCPHERNRKESENSEGVHKSPLESPSSLSSSFERRNDDDRQCKVPNVRVPSPEKLPNATSGTL